MEPGRIRAPRSRNSIQTFAGLCLATAMLLAAPLVLADRTQVKPGWNIFTTDQDVEIGQKLAAQTESKMPMLGDKRVEDYLNALGRRIARHAPGVKFPYEFHVVNSQQVNSFALPGGEVFIYRGVIEEAGDEAQLAGVVAHEISHVALRHGTNQATKSEMSTGILGILGSMVGGGSVGMVVSQAGGDLSTSSFLLKYSRATETQADVLGTQILYDAGYDPRAMGQFFENIEQGKHGRFAEMFSNHPIPERRIERIDQEIDNMGGPPKDFKTDSAEFRDIRRYVVSLPPPPPEKSRRFNTANIQQAPPASVVTPRSDVPANMHVYTGATFTAYFPTDWHATGQGDSVSILAPRGMVIDAQGNPTAAYGVIANVFQPAGMSLAGGMDGATTAGEAPAVTLEEATNQLMASLRESSPNLKAVTLREEIELDGQPALSVKLTNDSQLGGPETDLLVTVLRPQGLLYIICAAPQSEYADYSDTFEGIISSIHLTKQKTK
jgi:Zn-dependent protease with chaperone function